jgi:TolB protein
VPAAATTGATPGGAAFRAEDLAGRLLFVRGGVIWQWRGRAASPLLGDGAAFQPAFSPDGSRIAYVARGNDYSDVLLADAAGAPITQLTTNGSRLPINSQERIYATTWAFYPAWAPSGDRLAVAAQPAPPAGDPAAEYNLGLFELSVGDGARTQLYAPDSAHCGRSVYTSSGDLLFVRAGSGASGQQQIYRMDRVGGGAEAFPGAPTPSYDPAISPDGRWLAFATRDDVRTDIFALPLAGGGAPIRLSAVGSARAPAFSPDGRQIAFLAIAPGEGGFDLWVADLTADAGGGLRVSAPRRLTTGLGLDADSGLSWAA